MPKAGAAYDMGLFPTRNFVVEPVAALPSTVTDGRTVRLTADGDFYMGLAGSWVKISRLAVGDISGLQTALNGKAASNHSHGLADSSITGTLPATKGGLGVNAGAWGAGAIPYRDGSDFNYVPMGTAELEVLIHQDDFVPSWIVPTLSTLLPSAAFKSSVRVATTASITLSNTQTIDGVALAVGDRVLVKNQASASENGIYRVSSGSWQRADDANFAAAVAGAIVNIDSGGQGGQLWSTTFKSTDTLGTTAMTWFKDVDSSISITAGTGLTGGGDFSASRTLAINFAASGTSSTTQAVRADDSRLTNARTPTGTAGGSLTGTYPNPTLAASAINNLNLFTSAVIDQAASSGSLRTLGFGAQQALAGTTRLDQLAAPTASVGLNGQKITGLADPTSPNDAATKNYVDNAIQGISPKNSVVAATTANITLSGTQSIDGYTVAVGDRVLVKNQSTGSQNGIYIVASGAWSRSTDADTSADLSAAFTFVERGTTQADTGWIQTADGITLGTTALVWVQFSGAGQVVAGNGLSKSGNTLNVVGTSNRISVSSTAVDIASTYVGQTSITTLGTITTGVWNGTTIAITRGGTGGTTVAQAKANLEIPTAVSFVMPAMTAGTWTNIPGAVMNVISSAWIPIFIENGELVIELDMRVNGTNMQARSDTSYAAGAITGHIVGFNYA